MRAKAIRPPLGRYETEEHMNRTLRLPALRTKQGDTVVYLLFLKGSDIMQIADIRRIKRGEPLTLDGFQRKEIREHVNEIAQYLNKGGRLFPNAIILALEPETRFESSRGTKAEVDLEGVTAGRLHIPEREKGQRSAWIVDGQQRSLALEKSTNSELAVPVVAFETGSIDVQREQFILVNRAKPLPKRLIDELLPETGGAHLPRDLTMRQLPSQLCNALNTNNESPLQGMIRRSSQGAEESRVIMDTALLGMIKRSLNNPNGALAGYKSLADQSSDASAMLQILIDFWSAVKKTFPSAWGKPASESRLMHSAGIAALGDLMDRIAARSTSDEGQQEFFTRELARIAKDCAWTSGRWSAVNRAWNEFENTKRDIKILSQVLVQLYAQRSRQ